ncbi:RNA-binding protein RO60 isoform X2 [Dendroctonus ponderosae]|uniref:TROVE domain-containing protein n=3 Tax=Dendroctonus ponderosae TaxID=77166 RepID=A0AAR5PY43_DENPD|nr:RNA-binding protein RO60 isoform X2 [Dendroctonus ponderosae]KAH1022621.1 hypothetical protein HUJ04_011999 [Dendroctonus ponderosae]
MIASLSLDQRLRRLIYMNSVMPEFHVGDPDIYQVHLSSLRLTVLQEALDDDLKQLFLLINKAMAKGGIPRRPIIFQLLALLMTNPEATADQKNRIMAKVLELSDNDKDFFGFICCYTRSRAGCKLPTSVAKGVRKFYGAKNPEELARSIAASERICGWSHKDLIKLAHVKPNSPLMSAVFNYILTRKLDEDATEAQLEVLRIIKQAEQLRRCVDPAEAAILLKTSEFSLEHLMPSLTGSEQVWNAVLLKLSTQQILGLLLKLHKLNFLTPASLISCLVIQLLTDPERVEKSGVHPLEVFKQLRRLEKGGKPVDPKLLTYLKTTKKLSEENLRKIQETQPIDCPHIVSALWRCFDLACANVTPSHKRYLVVIEVPPVGENRLCIGSKTVTYLEAAVAFAAVLQRVEPQVTLAVHQKADSLQLVRVKKPCPVEELLRQVAATNSAGASLPTCFTWATAHRERVDVFVNFVQKSPRRSGHSRSPALSESMLNYQTAMNLPNTKMIVFIPVESPLEGWDKTPTKVLTIMGFDHIACKVAQCFARDDFS